MMNALAMFGLIVLIVWIMFLFDWMARRKERRTHDRPVR